jgi:coenzyme F420-reducing hydrogenase alpha subunit
MIHNSFDRLQYLCNTIPTLLRKVSEEEFAIKPGLEKWSKKEILGHLLDSATNNHQRFVRGQFEDVPAISYAQNEWVKHSYYNDMSSTHLISFWEIYNKHLLELIKRIPEVNLSREVNAGGNKTLAWLIQDYVIHMEHHLKQLVSY